MKKVCLFLLAALMLCGLFACKSTDPEGETEALSASEEDANGSQPHEMPEVTYAEQAMTRWESTRENSAQSFFFSSDGTAMLNANVQMRLTERDGAYTVQILLGDEPYGTMRPAFRAGTVRLLTDGETLKIVIADDPYGVLAFEITDKTFQKAGTISEQPQVWFNDTPLLSESMQPGTYWEKYTRQPEEKGCWIAVTDDLRMHGTVTAPLMEENSRDVAFSVMTDSVRYAFLSNETMTTDGERELQFYGISRAVIDGGYDRTELAVLRLEAIYDPQGLARKGYLTLCREMDRAEDTLFPFQLGANVDTVIRVLTGDGWTDETAKVAELDPLLNGCAVRLVKDGKTLFGLWSEQSTLFGNEPTLEAFVLYDKDGSVLSWCGRRPIERAAAEAFTKTESYEFSANYFYWSTRLPTDGYITELYFLDEGSIAIYREPMDNSNGGGAVFKIIRVIA